MKAILISLVALCLIPLSGCRESPALVELCGIDLYLNGYWYEAEPSEDNSVVWAVITNDTTEVYMRSEDGTDYLMWNGTYTEPNGKPDRYSWVSTNTQLRYAGAAYMSGTVQNFEYWNGVITFQRNVDTEVSLTKVPAEYLDTSTSVDNHATTVHN